LEFIRNVTHEHVARNPRTWVRALIKRAGDAQALAVEQRSHFLHRYTKPLVIGQVRGIECLDDSD